MSRSKLLRFLFNIKAILVLGLISVGGRMKLDGLTNWGTTIMLIAVAIFFVDAYFYWKADEKNK